MLTANLDNIRVLATDMTEHELNYTCPFCNEKMSLVKPSKKIVDHFRHHLISSCVSEPETIEHLEGKSYLYNFFKTNGYLSFVEPKISVLENNEHIDLYPDILLKSINRVAIEFQCSPISMDDFLRKTRIYSENNIYCLWIFGTKKFYNIIDKNYDLIRLRNIEKKSHELYYGNVYYLDQHLCARKFVVHTEEKHNEWNGNDWIKYYKKLRVVVKSKIIVHPVIRLKRNTWKENNFLVACLEEYNI